MAIKTICDVWEIKKEEVELIIKEENTKVSVITRKNNNLTM